jgi:two-component system, chemotaxis family, chemotaxis protein CheY
MAKTVLIVDDSRFILDMTGFILSSEGYNVLTALGGFEALEIMNRDAVDLAVIDINMPGMDGYTLIKKIRSDTIFEEIPVIIVTTEAEAKDKQKGFEAGANAYLIKPVQPDEIIAQIRLLIGKAGETEK